jgi:hypothetical protein
VVETLEVGAEGKHQGNLKKRKPRNLFVKKTLDNHGIIIVTVVET